MNVNLSRIAGTLLLSMLPVTAFAQASGEDQSFAQCAVGEINGISADNAATAVQLVCNAITSRVSPDNGSSYRVDMGRLGRLAILTVRTIRAGEPDKAMSVQLEGIEEVAVAAPRLGEAVATGKPFASSATVDNLVSEENRKYAGKKRDGESLFGAGLFGLSLLGANGDANGAGLIGKWEYQAPGFAAGASSFFGIESPLFVGISVDGRKFFSEADFAPFAGGGLAYVGFYNDEVSNGSLGAYVSGGLEAFRTYQNRLTIEARAFLPFSESEGGCTYDYTDGSEDCSSAAYVVPVMLNLTYMMPN